MAWVSFKVTIHRSPGLSNRDSDWVKVINSGIKCRALWLKRERKKVTIMDLINWNHSGCETPDEKACSVFFSPNLIGQPSSDCHSSALPAMVNNILWKHISIFLILRFISANIQTDFLIWNPNWRSEVKTSGEGRCLMLQSSLYPLMISHAAPVKASISQTGTLADQRSVNSAKLIILI